MSHFGLLFDAALPTPGAHNMTTANTGTASNVFAGMLLCRDHCAVLQGIVVVMPYFEACELLEYAT